MKHIVLIIFIALFSSFTYSQNNEGNNFKFPPLEIGLNINQLKANDKDIENKMGFGVSICRIWFPEKRISIVSGLLFSQTRYFENYISSGQYSNYKDMTFSLYSFSVPLLLRANFGHTYKIFAETGPSFDLMPVLRGNGIEVTYPPIGNNYETKISGGFDHDLTAFGANFGIGLKFPLKSLKMIIGSSYHCDLNTILEKRTNTLYNNYLLIRLGIFIDG
jgi:hypothetical protein